MPISDRDRKILWGLAGNQCAMCRAELVQEQPDQIRGLVDAAMTNSQVRNILTDADVKAFYEILSSRYSKHIEPDSLAWFREQWADDD